MTIELWEEKTELFRGLPSHIGIELTTNDNQPKRPNAPAVITSRTDEHLDRENWKQFLENAKELNFRQQEFSIDFWDFGEPLVHKRAIEYICAAANAGIRTDLYTNGLLLDEQTSEKLIDAGLNALFIRLDALDAETYARINQTDPEDYEKVIANLDTFLKLRKQKNDPDIFPWFPYVVATMTLHEENKDQAIKFIKKYDQLKQLRHQFAENEEKKTGPREVNLLQEFYQNYSPIEYALIREANHYCGQATHTGNYDYTPLTRKPCRQLREGPYLLANGKYTICREDINATQTIGDTTDNIKTLWRSKKMDKIFRIHRKELWQSHPLCQNCQEWYNSYV